jgi:hypothetical protein
MSKRNNQNRKAGLALAMAAGHTVPDWARDNQVASRTAYTWSRSPEVTDAVDRIRRDVLDRAIGRLSDHATAAADRIAKLACEASSESVQLAACRAVLAELMAISNYAAIEKRLALVERQLRDGASVTIIDIEPEPASAGDDRAAGDEEVSSCPA